jgi:hypothetical protein
MNLFAFPPQDHGAPFVTGVDELKEEIAAAWNDWEVPDDHGTTAWAAVPDAAAATRRAVRRSSRRKAAPATPISIDDLAISATEIAEPNEPEPRRNALAHAADA